MFTSVFMKTLENSTIYSQKRKDFKDLFTHCSEDVGCPLAKKCILKFSTEHNQEDRRSTDAFHCNLDDSFLLLLCHHNMRINKRELL